VSGPPGVGKSTELFGWASYVATSLNVPVVWVHHSVGYWWVVKMHGTQGSWVTFDSDAPDYKHFIVESCKGSQVVILDGIRKELLRLFKGLRKTYGVKNMYVVLSTSYAAGKSDLNQDSFFRLLCSYFVMTSWTLEQYEGALASGVIFPPDTTSETLHEQYCYGGGSMRLMLGSQKSTIEFLNVKLEKVSNVEALLSGLAGKASKDYVNALMQFFDNSKCSIPVSEYVKHKLIEKFDMKFVNAAKLQLQNNRSFQGWVFELEFTTRLRLAFKHSSAVNKTVILVGKDGTTKHLLVNHFVTFAVLSLQRDSLIANTAFVPYKWNQGCYDGVYYTVRDRAMVFEFYQCTIATSHVLKFQYVANFLAKFFDISPGRRNAAPLPQIEVNFFIVTPRDNVQAFNSCVCEDVLAVQQFDPEFSFSLDSATSVMHFD